MYGFVPNACTSYRYQSDHQGRLSIDIVIISIGSLLAEICRYLWDTWYKLTKSSGLHNESICLG